MEEDVIHLIWEKTLLLQKFEKSLKIKRIEINKKFISNKWNLY
jgi:hypothetical protein